MFVLVYEEQNKTESILQRCLPQLKAHHGMLNSYGNFEQINEQFKVEDWSQKWIPCLTFPHRF